jgi:hypothetical protein
MIRGKIILKCLIKYSFKKNFLLFLSIIYINISDLNEAINQIYSTEELITFLDVLYPQIEHISKVFLTIKSKQNLKNLIFLETQLRLYHVR